MYLSLLMKGRQPNDCDATSSHTGSVEAATKGLSKSGDYFSATRAAVSKEQLRQLVRIFSLRSELSRFAAISRMGRAIGAIPTRRWEPAEAEKGQADAHSVLGMAGCRLMLKFRRRRRVAVWRRSARAPAAVRVMTPRARICTYPRPYVQSARFGLSFKDERQWGDSFPPLPSSPTSFADLDQ